MEKTINLTKCLSPPSRTQASIYAHKQIHTCTHSHTHIHTNKNFHSYIHEMG